MELRAKLMSLRSLRHIFACAAKLIQDRGDWDASALSESVDVLHAQEGLYVQAGKGLLDKSFASWGCSYV
eukprot:6475130-Amphidinium_carterae.1